MIDNQENPNLLKPHPPDNLPFQTQVSQEHHSHDKDLAPWVRQKTIMQPHEYSKQQLDYHKFLANIRLSPRQNGRIKKNNNNGNSQQCINLEMIKADLSNKIKAQKICNNQYSEEKGVLRANQCRTFLQRRTNLTKLYKRPKSIQLSLDFQPIGMISCKPYTSSPNNRNKLTTTSFIVDRKRKQRNFAIKLKKKKHTIQGQQNKFAETFHSGFRTNILDAQKKMFQTLQLAANTFYSKSLPLDSQRTINASKQRQNGILRQKTKKTKLQRVQKSEILNQQQMITCHGISAITSHNQTCRQKVKNKIKYIGEYQ